jgi:hypothetical protein
MLFFETWPAEQWQKGAPEMERLFSGNVCRSTA